MSQPSYFGRIGGLAAVLWAIWALLLIAYFGVSQLFPRRTLGAVLVLLLVRQAMVLGRIWSRLLFYASQCEMWRGHALPPCPARVPPAPAS